jgi:hypothetical protein
MNTFGLGKGANRLWLGIPYSGLVDGWREIVRFVAYITQKVTAHVER